MGQTVSTPLTIENDKSGNRRGFDRKIMHQVSIDEESIKDQLVKRRKVHKWTMTDFSKRINGEFRHPPPPCTIKKLIRAMKPEKKTQKFKLYSRDIQGISEAGLQALGHSFTRCNRIDKIDLCFKKIKLLASQQEVHDKGLLNICQGLKKLPSLKGISLDIKNCQQITDFGISSFGKNLKRMRSLEDLKITCGTNDITGASFDSLRKSLRRQALSTRDIELVEGDRVYDDVFLSILESFKRNHFFTNIHLIFYELEDLPDEALILLATGLEQQKCLRNLYLNFEYCLEITGRGVTRIHESLKELIYLEKLYLDYSYCDRVEEIRPVNLGKLVSLKEIELGLCCCEGLGQPELSALGETLKTLPSLEKIRVDFTDSSNINGEGFVIFVQELQGSTSLNDVDLLFQSCENFGNTQLLAVGKCLGGFHNLRKITLECDKCKNISDDGVITFGDHLKDLAFLKELYLDFSEFKKICMQTDYGLSGLSEGLSRLTSLEKFTLRLFSYEYGSERIKDKGFLSFCDNLKQLKSLKKINLNFAKTSLSDKGFVGLCKCLRKLKSLTQVHLGFHNCNLSNKTLKELGESFKQQKDLNSINLAFWNCPTTQEAKHSLEGELTKNFPKRWVRVDVNE